MLEISQCEDKNKWDEFIINSGGHPLQLWGWGQLKESHGWKCDRLFGLEDGVVKIAVSVLTKKLPKPFNAMCYIPRDRGGETNQFQEFIKLVENFLKKKYKPVVLTIEPDSIQFVEKEGWRVSTNQILKPSTIHLDLNKSESQLLSEMAKKTRQYIRKSAADVRVVKVKSRAELASILSIYKETSKRANFNIHSDHYYEDVFSFLGENNQIYVALKDSKPVAFLWIAITARTAYELYGGMNDNGSELRANYALKWHAIQQCKKWGLEVYDFGGLLETGVSTFKRNWTTDDTVLAGTFDRPMSAYYSLWSRLLPKVKKAIQKIKKIGRN